MPFALHPIVEHLDCVLVFLFAALTVIVSALVNPHSTPWLLSIYLTLGLLVATHRSAKRSALHRSYALYLVLLGLYLLNVWFLHIWIPGADFNKTKSEVATVARFLRIGSIFMSVGLYHFTLRFARVQSRSLRAIEILGWIVGIAFFGTNLAGMFATDYIWSKYTWAPKFQGVYEAFFYFTSFFVTLGLAVPVVQIMRSRERQQRLQLTYYVLGAFPLWLTCLGHFLLSMGINIYPAGGIIFLFHVAIMAYAVFQKQLFDFSLVIRRGLAYALMSVVLGLVYAGFTWLLYSALGVSNYQPTLAMVLLFFFIAGVLQSPVLNFCQKQIDGLFFRANTDRRLLVENFTKSIAMDIELSSLVSKVGLTLDTAIRPRDIRIFIVNRQGRAALFGSICNGGFIPAPWPDSEVSADLPAREPMLISTMDSGADGPQHAGLTLVVGGQSLHAPLLAGKELLGSVLLGPKLSDTPYVEEDVQFVAAICAQSSVAVTNARSYAELVELQALNNATLKGTSAGVILFNNDGELSQCNAAFLDIFCIKTSPKTLDDLWSIQPNVASAIRRAVASEGCSNHELRFEGQRSTSVLLTVQFAGAHRGARLYVAILHDITDYKRMEETAQRKQHLARLGEAIASINHELRNVLQPIQYQIKKLVNIQTDDPVIKRIADVVPERARALDKLLQNLKDLARPITLDVRRIDLRELSESVWRDIADSPLSKHVKFSCNVDESARHCQGDGHWLRLVFFNLFRNSVEAMITASQAHLMIRTEQQGAFIRISVNDNGCGIKPSSKERLFEPFFSTKGKSGTGLGLSICRKIVELHSGKLLIESEEGKGVTVEIHLPCPQHEPISSGDNLS